MISSTDLTLYQNDKLTYTVVSQTSFGKLTGTAPNLVYTPNARVIPAMTAL